MLIPGSEVERLLAFGGTRTAPAGMAALNRAFDVTPAGLLWGIIGEFGILPGHVPLLAAVKAGVLRYRAGAERGRLVIGPGFARADGKDEVSVVVQKSLAADKVSREAAEKLLQDAEARLQEEGDEAKTAVATTDRESMGIGRVLRRARRTRGRIVASGQHDEFHGCTSAWPRTAATSTVCVIAGINSLGVGTLPTHEQVTCLSSESGLATLPAPHRRRSAAGQPSTAAQSWYV